MKRTPAHRARRKRVTKCCGAEILWEGVGLTGMAVYRETKNGTRLYRSRCAKCWRLSERRNGP